MLIPHSCVKVVIVSDRGSFCVWQIQRSRSDSSQDLWKVVAQTHLLTTRTEVSWNPTVPSGYWRLVLVSNSGPVGLVRVHWFIFPFASIPSLPEPSTDFVDPYGVLVCCLLRDLLRFS